MGVKTKEHRRRLEARNNRIRAIEKRYRQTHGVKPGDIVTFKRSKARGLENKSASTLDSHPIGEGRTIYNWDRPSKFLMKFYEDSQESKKGGFGMGRVISVWEEKGIRTVSILTMDKKWRISVEEKYVGKLEEEEDSLISALDDIGQI